MPEKDISSVQRKTESEFFTSDIVQFLWQSGVKCYIKIIFLSWSKIFWKDLFNSSNLFIKLHLRRSHFKNLKKKLKIMKIYSLFIRWTVSGSEVFVFINQIIMNIKLIYLEWKKLTKGDLNETNLLSVLSLAVLSYISGILVFWCLSIFFRF